MVWLESALGKGVGEQQGGVVLVPAELVAIHLGFFFTATNWHFDIFRVRWLAGKIHSFSDAGCMLLLCPPECSRNQASECRWREVNAGNKTGLAGAPPWGCDDAAVEEQGVQE